VRSLASAFVAERGSAALAKDDVERWLCEVQGRIAARAIAENNEPRDFASTLVFVVASEQATVCAQIGDGAIVLNSGDGLAVALWPENGEYANQTYFVSQDDAAEHIQFAKFGPVQDFVVFSDGLQRLALNQAERAPYPGFFGPLLRTVRSAEELDDTTDQLETFLESDRVNGKTDDDKSIVIGCRID
jgi:hypothetical protein